MRITTSSVRSFTSWWQTKARLFNESAKSEYSEILQLWLKRKFPPNSYKAWERSEETRIKFCLMRLWDLLNVTMRCFPSLVLIIFSMNFSLTENSVSLPMFSPCPCRSPKWLADCDLTLSSVQTVTWHCHQYKLWPDVVISTELVGWLWLSDWRSVASPSLPTQPLTSDWIHP